MSTAGQGARWSEGTARTRRVLVAVAVVLAVSYTVTALLYARSTGSRGLLIKASAPPGGIAVLVEVMSVDPSAQVVRARVSVDPDGALVDSAGQLREAITVVTTANRPELTYAVGQRPQPEDVTFFIDGAAEDYPLDRWATLIVAVAFPTGTPAEDIDSALLPVSVGVESSVPSWVTRDAAPDEVGGDTPATLLESAIGLRFVRAGSTMAIAVLVLALMAVLAALGALVALAVATGRRRVEPTLAGFMAALLFALVPLRNALPGAPPLGAWIDFLVFFWVEIILMASLAVYVVTWLQRGARPDATAQRS